MAASAPDPDPGSPRESPEEEDTSAPPADLPPEEQEFLRRFWAGEKKALEKVYLEHFDSVFAAVGRILFGADQETVTQEVFFRMVSEENFRRRYRGGALRAWLCTVARNRAIDFYRRKSREEMTEDQDLERMVGAAEGDRFVAQTDARRLVERFRREVLPAKWAPVFEARFVGGQSQREAASTVGISRTTLAYQEARIRSLLKRFMLSVEDPSVFAGQGTLSKSGSSNPSGDSSQHSDVGTPDEEGDSE